ncbi:MAG: hypothetical protein ACO3FA_00945 [Vulcanococcus sp.]
MTPDHRALLLRCLAHLHYQDNCLQDATGCTLGLAEPSDYHWHREAEELKRAILSTLHADHDDH